MSYKVKYVPSLKRPVGHGGPGSPANPAYWTEDAMIERDKYYGLLKHKAQAKFRNEEHSLTWEEWQQLWPTDLWLKRGRGVDDLCISIVNLEHGWHSWNVTICTRGEHLKRAREYRDRSRL
jgi:hypothetical protein